MKTGFVTDSTFYMDHDVIEKYNIEQVSLSVNFENVSYSEINYENGTQKEIFKKIKLEKKLPTSSQPTSKEFFDGFKNMKDQGYERLLVFTISSKLSGTYQNACISAEAFKQENPDIIIDVFDSYNVASGAVASLLQIIKAQEFDNHLSNETIQSIIDFTNQNAKFYFVVDDLNFLAYGGRISPTIASVGNIVGLKPILQIKDGMICEFSKVRSKKKAYKVILDELEKDTANLSNYYFSMIHLEGMSDMQKLTKYAKAILDERCIAFPNKEIGPVVSIHVGTGTIGLFYCPEYRHEKMD